jgi:hypothetical protein
MRAWFLSYELHLLAMALMVLPAMFEFGVNWPLPRAMYLAYAALGGALLWLCNGLRWTKRTTNAGLLFVSLLACLHLMPWSTRKVFLTKFQSIEPGTTLEAVHALLEPYVFRENRSTRRDMARSYWHSPVGHYDSDVGTVRFRDGRVVETLFLPD